MEPNTRQLTFEEMYFKKPGKTQVSAPANQNSINNGLFDAGGHIPHPPIYHETPNLDLSEPVFQSPSFSKKAGKFVAKNWPWLLIGTSIIVVVGVTVYKNSQKEKKTPQFPIYPYHQS